MYRMYVKPREKSLFDFIHYRPKAKVSYDSCGSVSIDKAIQGNLGT